MAKRLTEKQRKEIVKSFTEGKNVNFLSETFNCNKLTIIRNLKKSLGDIKYKEFLSKSSYLEQNLIDEEHIFKEDLRVNHDTNCVHNSSKKDFIIKKLPQLDLGRVAAQNAKGVIIQKVREADKTKQFEEYKDKVGEISTRDSFIRVPKIDKKDKAI